MDPGDVEERVRGCMDALAHVCVAFRVIDKGDKSMSSLFV
jgi:hypothetical protein